MLQPHDLAGKRRSHADRVLEMTLEPAAADAQPTGGFRNGQRRVDGLLHEQKRLLYKWIVGRQVKRNAGLRLFRSQCVVDDHDMEALKRLRAPDMPVDQPSGQMRRACTARAGQAIAIDDEDLVGDGSHPVELFQEIRMVEPTHATALAVHKPSAV